MKKNMVIAILVISTLICSFYAFYDLRYNFILTDNFETKLDINDIEDNKDIENDKDIEDKTDIDIDNKQNNNSNNIFYEYEDKAYQKLQELTLDDKIRQTLIVRHNDDMQKDDFNLTFGGIVFFEKDFKGKTKKQVIDMINNLQEKAKIPLLTAIDEEGGKVSRLSSNPNLVETPFKSSQELYNEGGFEAIKKDTLYKSEVLSSLGLNLNLAPVVDIAKENDYIYERTIGLNATLTSTYAKTIIEMSKVSNVSYTLKHFPGYGNNADTHKGISIDTREYEQIINNDLKPFQEGIKAGAEAIMVSHNIVTSIDKEYPSTLSKKIHDLLRNDLKFTGVIITDDLSMKALDEYDNAEVMAIKAGNDLLITSDYSKSFNNIKNGLNNNLITEEELDNIVLRILAWKYYKQIL